MAEIVLDIETQKSFDEVGGRTNFAALGVSLAVVYDYGRDAYQTFFEKDLKELENVLARSDRVIGFNVKNFDYAVLQPHLTLSLKGLPTLDIMEEVANTLGFRVSLDSVASATLGERKTGDGLKALRLYKEGKLEELAEYCRQDVKLTRDVYEYGAANGKLYYESRIGAKNMVQVGWQKLAREDRPLTLGI